MAKATGTTIITAGTGSNDFSSEMHELARQVHETQRAHVKLMEMHNTFKREVAKAVGEAVAKVFVERLDEIDRKIAKLTSLVELMQKMLTDRVRP